MLDALARLRFDEPTLLTALEAHVAGALERGALHEAQAACVVESFGTLRYRPRAELLTKLLERVHSEGGGGGTTGCPKHWLCAKRSATPAFLSEMLWHLVHISLVPTRTMS